LSLAVLSKSICSIRLLGTPEALAELEFAGVKVEFGARLKFGGEFECRG
jgi:hypothetical protein